LQYRLRNKQKSIKIIAKSSSKNIFRWIFTYLYFAFDNVFKNKKRGENLKKTLKNVKKRLLHPCWRHAVNHGHRGATLRLCVNNNNNSNKVIQAHRFWHQSKVRMRLHISARWPYVPPFLIYSDLACCLKIAIFLPSHLILSSGVTAFEFRSGKTLQILRSIVVAGGNCPH